MAKCPVAELERQRLAAATVVEAAERQLRATPEGPRRGVLQMEAAAARALAQELLEEMWSAVAASEHGIILQLIGLYEATDAGDTATVERLGRHIREAVDTIARALSVRLTAQDGDPVASEGGGRGPSAARA
jgi:hypothetical protein